MKNRNAVGTFYKLFFLAALFFSVFVLSQLGDNFWAVGAAGVVLLIAGYLFLAQSAKEKQEEKERDHLELDRKLDELLNTQRAIHTMIKRGSEKPSQPSLTGYEDAEGRELLAKLILLQERMLSENRKFAEIQVDALKTVAKYNKQNARQLAKKMNENTDRLASQLREITAGSQEKIGISAEQEEFTSREICPDAAVDMASMSEGNIGSADEIEQVNTTQGYEENYGMKDENFAEEQDDGLMSSTELISEINLESEIIADPIPEIGGLEPEINTYPIPEIGGLEPEIIADPISEIGSLESEISADLTSQIGDLEPEISADLIPEIGDLEPEINTDLIPEIGGLESEVSAESIPEIGGLKPEINADLIPEIGGLGSEISAESISEIGGLDPEISADLIPQIDGLEPEITTEPALGLLSEQLSVPILDPEPISDFASIPDSLPLPEEPEDLDNPMSEDDMEALLASLTK